MFNQVIRKQPANPVWHYHLGLALKDGGQLTEAKNAFENALRRNPSPGLRDTISKLLGSLG
jgi:tetratricopeptide (TPR) repeat protein